MPPMVGINNMINALAMKGYRVREINSKLPKKLERRIKPTTTHC